MLLSSTGELCANLFLKCPLWPLCGYGPRQVVTSSALASPSADEIRLANQANFIAGREGTITEVDFSIVGNSVKLRHVDEGSSSAP